MRRGPAGRQSHVNSQVDTPIPPFLGHCPLLLRSCLTHPQTSEGTPGPPHTQRFPVTGGPGAGIPLGAQMTLRRGRSRTCSRFPGTGRAESEEIS